MTDTVRKSWIGCRLINLPAVLPAVVLVTVTLHAQAGEEKKRFPITPFVEAKAGTYFDFTSGIQGSNFGASALAFFRKRDTDKRRAAPIAAMDLDELTRWYMIADESYQSVLLQMKFAHEVYNQPRLPPAVAERIRHRVVYPDNSSELVPFGDALLLYFGMLRLLDAELRSRDRQHDLSGDYIAVVSGGCPFADGPVQLEQRSHLIEGVRGDRLLLAGAVGETRAWFVATEQRYGTVTMESDGSHGTLKIDAPDAPSELYAAAINDKVLDLVGEVHGGCRITLRQNSP